jgi:capsular polysaccharide biosynthesis protein
MTRHLKLSPDEIAPLRGYYQGIAYDVWRTVLRHRTLVMRFVAGGFAIAIVAMVTISPRYTSEALLQVNFSREEPNTTTKTQRIASMEAAAVVESALRILRSRALAGAVVSRLGLADDPEFAGQPSRLMRVIWSVRRMFGLSANIPTAQDLAADRLAGALQVNIVPRSYVISIVISASEPQRAAQLANAVALEYLRGQQIQHLVDLQRTLERDFADMSALYGAYHPRSLDAKERLQELQIRIVGLRRVDMPAETVSGDTGEFLAAEAVMMPSGPSLPIVFALVLSLSLLTCGCVVAFLEFTSPAAYWGRFAAIPAHGDENAQVVTVHGPAQESSAARRLA